MTMEPPNDSPCAHCGAYLEPDDSPCVFCPNGVITRRRDHATSGHWFTLTVVLNDDQDITVAGAILDAAITRLRNIHGDRAVIVLTEGDRP
jgi:hypothetical protein